MARYMRTWMLAAVLPLTHAGTAAAYQVSYLASDIPGVAAFTDPNLVNPWGLTSSSSSPFWIADNGTGVSTLYDGAGEPFPVASPLVVTISPPAGGAPPAAPTGAVFNGGAGFELQPGQRALFIFATEDGTISGWNPAVNPTTSTLKVDNSASGAVYKGLALGSNGSSNFLYAANFRAATIDVFDSNFSPTALLGSFIDPSLPAGFAPFNVENLGGNLFVTYALQAVGGFDDVPGAGNGFVDVFDPNGSLVRRLASQGPLNSPWGLALAPASFGAFSNDLLVGNFGDGRINAFDPVTGTFLGPLTDGSGQPIVIDGLWGLRFGNGGNGGDSNTLYFTAGIPGDGALEDHGLFGSIAVPEPTSLALSGFGLALLAILARARRSPQPTAAPSR